MDVAHFQSGRLISRFAWAATAWMLPLALSVLMVAPAGAATWTANSGTWSVTSNWGGAALPNGANTDARLYGNGGTITVDGSGLTNATYSFTWMYPKTGAPAYTLTSGTLLLVASGTAANSDVPAIAGGATNLVGVTINSVITGSDGIYVNPLAWSANANGILMLGNSGNSYTGATRIGKGSLRAGAQNVLGGAASTSQVQMSNVGTLDLNGFDQQVGSISSSLQTTVGGSASLYSGGSITSASAATLTIGSDNLNSSYQGTITGSLAIVKIGSGTQTFAAANTYSGTTRISAGSLLISNSAALQNSTLDMKNTDAGTVSFSQNSTLGGLAGSRSINMGGYALSVGNNNATTTYGGALSNGSLTKIGSGTLVLTGSNTYAGGSTVSAGTLQIGNAGTSGSIVGNVSVATGAGIVFNRSDATTYSGTISGAGAVTVNGPGTLAFSGSNTYSGATTISAGQLQISAGNINASSGITVNGAGAEFKYNSATALNSPLTLTQGTLSGSGAIGTAVTVGSAAILSPGNSPGSQSFTSGLTFAQGGQYTWEINNWAGAAGTGYDQLVVSGSALNITATSGSTFKILVTSLTGSNTAGAVPGFVGTTGTTFTIATSSPAITGFDKSKFAIDTSTFTNNNTLPTNAGFWLSTNGGSTSLILNYAPSATYNLSAAASAAAIRVGGTSTITATVTSSTAGLTNPDTMSYTGLALNGGLGALSSTSGTLNPGGSSSGNVAFIPVGSGSVTFSPSVTTATNVNIATSANAGSTSGVTVAVYNPASANSLVSAVSLGNVYASGTFGTQQVSIWNTGTAAAAYQEGLAAAISGTSGQATGSGSVTNLFTSSTSTAISVGLGGNASTGSAGVKSGTVTLGFTSTGTTSVGATGLSPLMLASQSVAVTGTVWNPAAVNAITSPVSLGNVRVSGTFGTQDLSIQNTAASGSFTEVLGATATTSGLASRTGSVVGLAGGGTSTAISVGLSGAAYTATAGVKSGSATVSFTSTGGPGTAVINNQTVAISGTVWNPAAATTSGSVNLGSVIVGSTSAWTQALSITNSAPNTGFSESLNAAFGTLSGVTTNSGSFNLLAAGSTNNAALTVSLATGSVGNQAGSAQILFATDGQGTSGLGAESLSPQTVNVYGTVLDHALPGFVGTGITDPYLQTTLNLDFGSVDESAGTQTLTYSLTNLASLLYGPGLTAGLDLTAFTPDGGGFASGLSTFNNLTAGGTSSLLTASFTPSGQGTFSKTFTLSFSDNRNLAGATSVRSLTINTQVVVVPEPGTIALAGIGVLLAGWAIRSRRRPKITIKAS